MRDLIHCLSALLHLSPPSDYLRAMPQTYQTAPVATRHWSYTMPLQQVKQQCRDTSRISRSVGGKKDSPTKHRKRETLPDIARRIPVDALRPFFKLSLVAAAEVTTMRDVEYKSSKAKDAFEDIRIHEIQTKQNSNNTLGADVNISLTVFERKAEKSRAPDERSTLHFRPWHHGSNVELWLPKYCTVVQEPLRTLPILFVCTTSSPDVHR